MPMRDALHREHPPCADAPRIVSLVPSLTELVCDLDLAGQLVGRTGFCVHPKEALRSIPKVGGTKDVKLDVLRQLAPTHVIADIDESRREVVEEIMGFVPHVIVVHPHTVDDNLALYALLGHVFRREHVAARLATAFATARAELDDLARNLPREPVLYPIWREPWMTVRRDTYIAAMLAAAGWDSLPVEAASRYPAFDWNAPWLADVQRVLLPSEPYAFTVRDEAEVGELARLPVTRIDGEMVSWYGSRAIAGLRYLAALRRQQR
ncbi:MAG: ABC transporter substrate-binding protein [Sulfuritalea sp.]|nr:ABC transporter substrate-binding protein [Sulfuritalea sp.]